MASSPRARVDRSPSATSRWRTRSSASPPSAPPPWDSESSPFDRCYAPRVEDRNRAHHRRDRLGAKRRFDEVECTVSHLLRFPHPALGGRRYGEALLQGLGARGLGPGRSGAVEIGGGAGHVAEAAWRGDAGPFTKARWTAIDLSPALIAAQRRRALEPSQPRGPHARWAGIRADAVDLPLRSRSVDGLLLANEAIADLPVEAGRNAGAVRLVGEIARV